ncbi:MAG: calcium-binding EGF-like domain-containing protein, partial [Kofleriaceae bacterium]
MRIAAVVGVLVGCGFSPHVAHDPPPDGETADADAATMPIQCGDLTCDPHATCVTSSADATCACASGYSGDGFTCA